MRMGEVWDRRVGGVHGHLVMWSLGHVGSEQ